MMTSIDGLVFGFPSHPCRVYAISTPLLFQVSTLWRPSPGVSFDCTKRKAALCVPLAINACLGKDVSIITVENF